LGRTLDLCLSGEVRTQDAPYVIGSVLGSRIGSASAWPFLEEHWDTVRSRFPNNSIPRMLEAISALADPELARRIHAFIEAHPVPQEKLVAQSLEKLDNNVAFAARVAPDLPTALRAALLSNPQTAQPAVPESSAPTPATSPPAVPESSADTSAWSGSTKTEPPSSD
jgi:hypothetical protein